MISYTMPCHKREADLAQALPSVLLAADGRPTEVIVIDYGNHKPLDLSADVRRVTCAAPYFHMAHARNVGIRAARGSIVCAFVCDQVVAPDFFHAVRSMMHPGVFLTWQETYVFYRDDIVAAGGFDERFELYGPEGKELSERLERRGLKKVKLPRDLVYQIPTSYKDKISNYRLALSRREMHHIGMDAWAGCDPLVANQGKSWGACEAPIYTEYASDYLGEIRERIQAKIKQSLHEAEDSGRRYLYG